MNIFSRSLSNPSEAIHYSLTMHNWAMLKYSYAMCEKQGTMLPCSRLSTRIEHFRRFFCSRWTFDARNIVRINRTASANTLLRLPSGTCSA